MANLPSTTHLGYQVVDVFTDRPFAGNPLAVVLDAHALAGEQMQALAREFHLSETVFLLPPTTADAHYRVRIFTPDVELPFAGHPSIGAAMTAVRLGRATPDADGVVVQECGVGLLPVRLAGRGATLTGGDPSVGPPGEAGPLRQVVGLPGAESEVAPRVAGCGLDFAYLHVAADEVPRAELDVSAAARLGVPELCVFHWDAATRTARARVFCPGSGIPEDPATGSAALGLGAYLVATGLLPPDGEAAYTVRQGVELHRPSTLHGTVTAEAGTARRCTVAGEVVPVASGEIAVPPFVG